MALDVADIADIVGRLIDQGQWAPPSSGLMGRGGAGVESQSIASDTALPAAAPPPHILIGCGHVDRGVLPISVCLNLPDQIGEGLVERQ